MSQQVFDSLRMERLRRRLTQYDLSRLAGIRPDKISLLENGKIEPRGDELQRWSKALGLNLGGQDGEQR